MKQMLCGLLCLILALGLLSGCSGENADNLPENVIRSTELLNISFEEDLANWTLAEDNTEGASYTSRDSHSGDRAFACWSMDPYVSHVYQTIQGVEPGYYTLSAYVQSSGGFNAAYLYAQGSGQSKCMTAISGSNKLSDDADGWITVTVRGIRVEEDGVLTVGLYADAQKRQWINLDDLQLTKEETTTPFLIGGDVSQLNYVEDMGAKFYDADGVQADPLQILAESGWNFARLRLYNDPGPGRGDGSYYCHEDYMDPEDVLDMARRCKEKGMEIELTFHYSDYWTNGATQYIPAEWQKQIKGLDEEAAINTLEALVYYFTKDYMEQLKAQDTLPAYVSLGNETEGGMLFPYGTTTEEGWPVLARFYSAGYRAVKEVSPDTQVIIHLSDAGNLERYTLYFDNCLKYGAKFDIIGSSYYPFWTEKTVKEAEEFYNTITERYNCPVMVMETGYNWNPTRPDGWAGQLTDNGPYDTVYESTPEGQRDFMIDLFRALKNVNGGMVLGDLYWDPIFVDQPGVGWAFHENWNTVDNNVVSNTTQFDFDHVALPVLNAYRYNSNGVDYALLSGKIVGRADGTPIAFTQAEVKLGENTYTVTTDSCGGFLLHVPAGEMKLSVTAAGVQTITEEQTVTTALGEVTKVTIQVQGGSISGTVLDDSGRGVPNTVITAVSDSYSLTVTSGEDGGYCLPDLPEGSYTVSCKAEGYRVDTQPFAENIAVGDEKTGKNIQTTLTSGTLHGIIVDGSGKPLAGATVSAWSGDIILKTTTDENGEYTLVFVPAGYTYTVQGYLYTYESVEMTFDVAVGQTTETGEYMLVQALGTLSGTAVDRTGAPVADAQITATSDTGLVYTATTDAAGHYDLGDVLVGSYSISAAKTGLVTGNVQNVSVALGEHTDAAAITMPEPVSILNFSFEEAAEADNVPAGWVITCTESGTSGPAAIRQNRNNFGGTVDGDYGLSFWLDKDFTADCHQKVEGLTPGRYVLSAAIYSGMNGEYTMYVKDADGNLLAELHPSKTNGYVTMSVEFDVTGDAIYIGFSADAPGGDWAVMDQVELGMY